MKNDRLKATRECAEQNKKRNLIRTGTYDPLSLQEVRAALITKIAMRELSWYKYFVSPGTKSYLKSALTLIHLPFMLYFMCLTLLGPVIAVLVDPSYQPDLFINIFSLLVVCGLLYMEHCLDDTKRAGKPWNTKFTDVQLYSIALTIMASLYLGILMFISISKNNYIVLPFYVLGVVYTVLYSLEIKFLGIHFHTEVFAGLSMGTIPVITYILNNGTNMFVMLFMFIICSLFAYTLMKTYQHTKDERNRGFLKTLPMPTLLAWRMLFFEFAKMYLLTIMLAIIILI